MNKNNIVIFSPPTKSYFDTNTKWRKRIGLAEKFESEEKALEIIKKHAEIMDGYDPQILPEKVFSELCDYTIDNNELRNFTENYWYCWTDIKIDKFRFKFQINLGGKFRILKTDINTNETVHFPEYKEEYSSLSLAVHIWNNLIN